MLWGGRITFAAADPNSSGAKASAASVGQARESEGCRQAAELHR